MANELEKAITIKNAIDKIDAGDFLLPAIQRRFVWNTHQVEFLFDSIMQDYPINTFMFWEVKSENIKNNFRFYEFLKKYIEYQGGNNQEKNTIGYKHFFAVIDGQQRLNSLYIGLKGSYAFKQYVYRKRNYQKDELNYPTRKLFLDLKNPIENDEEKKVYDFRFLIHNEHQDESANKSKVITNSNGTEEIECYWFEVGNILKFKSEHNVITYLNDNKLDIGGFPGETLLKLYKLINEKPIINFFLEQEQDFDKILYEFIRTNAGGTKLSFADLLMSIITASWEQGKSTKGAREEIDTVINEIRELGFEVDQDFILKSLLVLVSNDIRFALRNFDSKTIEEIKKNWSRITSCIKASFELIKSFSFNNQSLRAKNAVIPIIYYLYINNVYADINKENRHQTNKTIIKRFLHIALLNKLFGGSSDGFLIQLRRILSNNIDNDFPLEAFKENFKGTNRRFSIDDEKLDSLLRTTNDSIDSFYLLSLLFPKFNFDFKNPNIDHLHPRTLFQSKNYKDFTEEQIEFYNTHYNSILNLAILSEEQNKSKNKTPLKDWIEVQERMNLSIRDSLLIPENVDLDFKNFVEFIKRREEKFQQILKKEF